MSTKTGLIFFFSCLLVGLLALGVAAWVKYGPKMPEPRPVMTRNEIRDIIGRSNFTSTIKGTFGAPDKTVDKNQWESTWIYYGISRDSTNGRVDRYVEFEVTGHLIVNVSFN